MRRLIRPGKNRYPPKVRGRIAKITQNGHELIGRYMWEIEIFCIPASGNITILKTIQSLYYSDVKSFPDEHKAKQHLQNMVDKIEASLEKVTKGRGGSGLIMMPGAFE